MIQLIAQLLKRCENLTLNLVLFLPLSLSFSSSLNAAAAAAVTYAAIAVRCCVNAALPNVSVSLHVFMGANDRMELQVFFYSVGCHFSHVISWMQCAQYSVCNVRRVLPHSYSPHGSATWIVLWIQLFIQFSIPSSGKHSKKSWISNKRLVNCS